MSEKPTAGATSSIEDQIRLREEKAHALRERGLHPYGNDVRVTTTIAHVREVHAADSAEQLEKEHTPAYAIAGRVMAIRTMGKATFLSLRDRTGDLQAFVKKDKVGEEAYEVLKLLDLGD
ncbi:MAG TPA: OB-fold nucleic acid binding domain-containing protein, partial [Myxococcales bacterium]|nr:OB-fold nucleic acid binding domain-containing protein [Myxococcales bacterium]